MQPYTPPLERSFLPADLVDDHRLPLGPRSHPPVLEAGYLPLPPTSTFEEYWTDTTARTDETAQEMSTMSIAESEANAIACRPLPLLPEIWVLIFPYLKPHDLHSISLTCSTFRYIAQPILFTVLDLSPFLLSYNTEHPILRPRHYLSRFMKRLECFKQPHIAHGVRHCWVSPYTRFGFPSPKQQDDLDPNLIINAAVEALPHFPNLHTLSWHCIDITPQWWQIIQSLKIHKLWLNSSFIPETATSPLPLVVHLDLDQWPWEGRTRITSPFTRSVPQESGCPLSSMSSTQTSLKQVHALRSLNVPFNAVPDSHFVGALEQCPYLESLCIFPPSSDEPYRDIKMGAVGRSTLRRLTAYEGPYTHVVQFAHQPLKQVSLWGFDDRPSLCDPEALVAVLTELAESTTAESLESLTLTVFSITRDLLESFSGFAHLRQIILQSQDNTSRSMPMPYSIRPNAPVTTLYTMMATASFPEALRFLKLTTRLRSPRLDLAEQEHEAACFTEAIARRHPNLQRIELGYGIYWTGTYSAVWGRIRNNVALRATNSNTGHVGSERSGEVSAGGDPNGDADPTTDPAAHPPRIAKEDMEGGYSSKSSSKDYIMSTVVSTVHPLPLGKLTFTEHRRTILFSNDAGPGGSAEGLGFGLEDGSADGTRSFWMSAWMRLRRLFGKYGS
ncbi:hypothetical protein NLJ89_g1593 [Agrocybe chaxingu]|uniref:F-box domain-containing protein n=1 Tax=Agrocybe chaxingu TaxID=84603 RepID=A0A9W8MZR9_9AGAR|nr:hypothetical protein NLJ89_g1593 [Agrocybe chaxingu]